MSKPATAFDVAQDKPAEVARRLWPFTARLAPPTAARRSAPTFLIEEVWTDQRASARLRRTFRLVQNIAALLRFECPPLPRCNDRRFNIVLAAYRANNTQTANASWDLSCIGAADETLHLLAREIRFEPKNSPRVREGNPGRTWCGGEWDRGPRVGSTGRSRALHNHRMRDAFPAIWK